MNKKYTARNSPKGKAKTFDDMFVALRYQQETSWGKRWLHTPIVMNSGEWHDLRGKIK